MVNRRPVEGTRADEPTVGDLARPDAITCHLSDRAGEIRTRVGASGYPFALVLSSEGVLLGRVPNSELDGDPMQAVEAIMDPGPKTYRPHKTAAGVAAELADRGLDWAIVTSPEGELIGVLSRAALEAAVGERR